jgi:acetyl esterase
MIARRTAPDIRALLQPEMRAALAESERRQADAPPATADRVASARAGYAHERRFWNAAPAPVHETRDLSIDTPLGPVGARLHRPVAEEATGITLYLHGGGYILGGLDTHDRIMRLLALASGQPVLGIDYALSPERRFPYALDQIAAVLEALPRHDLDVGRIALAGDSAGAHLSLGTALARPDPRLAGLLLYYGAFGLADSASRRLHGGELDGLSPDDLAFYRDSYLARPEDRRDLRYDCLSAELGGLPPCFIGGVALDPLRDDSLALAEGLKLAGVPHRLRLYHGVLHGFLHYSRMLPLAFDALAEGGRFLAERLAGPLAQA